MVVLLCLESVLPENSDNPPPPPTKTHLPTPPLPSPEGLRLRMNLTDLVDSLEELDFKGNINQTALSGWYPTTG